MERVDNRLNTLSGTVDRGVLSSTEPILVIWTVPPRTEMMASYLNRNRLSRHGSYLFNCSNVREKGRDQIARVRTGLNATWRALNVDRYPINSVSWRYLCLHL
ncbi:hypothetical protein TNCV_4445501 [Trichonephila clavipes]|nr:hypothetical protein TNCV_4445501 [Trichonephila clavipes]